MVGCNGCFDFMEKKIGDAFFRYGCFVARHPWKIIVIAVLINFLLGIGMLRLNYVIAAEVIYTPIGSQAFQDSDRVKELFPDLSGTNFISYQMTDFGKQAEVIISPKSGEALDATFLPRLDDLLSYIFAIKSEDVNGNTISVFDICAKSYGNCSIDGDVFRDPEFIAAVSNSSVTFPFFYHSQRGSIYIEQYIGGADVAGGIVSSATMLRIKLNLRTDSSYYIDSAKLWQDKFLAEIEKFSNNYFDIAYNHADSLSEEINDNIIGDILLFGATFVIMVVYACIATTTARWDMVGQRCFLGISGTLCAGLAIVAAYGLGSACGVDFVSVVGVVPFLIIGIGVDDMFLLMSGLTETNFKDSMENRIGETMRTSGVSITITSLTDVLAFAAGASSTFPSVRNFCIYAGIAICFCYINQATIFVASLAVNEIRMDGNRHFATCMKIRTPTEGKEEEKSKPFLCCCTGRKPVSQREVESHLDKLPRFIIPKLIKPIPGKIIIIILFAAYLGISIWGVINLKEGLNLVDVVAESSYYYTYRDWFDNNFPIITPVSFVFDQTITYSDASSQAAIKALLDKIKAEDTVTASSEINWLESYKQTPFYSNSSENDFIAGLQTFLSQTVGLRFQNDVVISSNQIITSRIHLLSVSISDSQEQGEFMLRMRELASESSFTVFAFSPFFIYYEQYVVILSQTIQTVGIAVAMVFFVTCIFMPHPLLLLYITVTVTMITVGIFGFLYFLDLTVSAITMMHIIMSIGFSVDFAAHICHGYMISKGKNRNERMIAGVIRSGAPIFHGAVSSFIGVLMLSAAQSFIFFSFFKVMSVVLAFGILHALLLLPVILSLVGPSASNSVDDMEKKQKVYSHYKGNLVLSNSVLNDRYRDHRTLPIEYIKPYGIYTNVDKRYYNNWYYNNWY